MKHSNPWDQLPDETNTAYHRFSVYVELGAERSLEKTRLKLGKSSGYLRQLQTWSTKYDWVARASKYDSHIIKKALKKREEIMDKLSVKVLSRAEELVDELLDLALHSGVVSMKEGELQLYSQKLKAIESALDRIGFVRQKEAPELDKPASVNDYLKNIYNRIGVIRGGGANN